MSNRISPQGGTLLGSSLPSQEGVKNVYHTGIRSNPNRYGFNAVPIDSIKFNGAFGLPVSADYTADRSAAPAKVFVSPVTRYGPLGLPFPAFNTGTRIIEQRDTVFAFESTARTGDGDATEGDDLVVANGVTGGTTPYSNEWFNQYWFNEDWFNADWFNTVIEWVGNANITEDGDDVSASGRVEMSGYGAVTEAHDTVDSYGSVGNDVLGEAYIYEDGDVVTATGDVTIHANADIIESADTVVAVGGGNTYKVLLSWETVGGMVDIAIYKSDDGITYNKIATVGGATSSYIDESAVLGETYYYYLIGTQTTGADTDQSDTESITIPT